MVFSFESRLSGDPERDTNEPFASDNRSLSERNSPSESEDGRAARPRAWCARAGPASSIATATIAHTIEVRTILLPCIGCNATPGPRGAWLRSRLETHRISVL